MRLFDQIVVGPSPFGSIPVLHVGIRKRAKARGIKHFRRSDPGIVNATGTNYCAGRPVLV